MLSRRALLSRRSPADDSLAVSPDHRGPRRRSAGEAVDREPTVGTGADLTIVGSVRTPTRRAHPVADADGVGVPGTHGGAVGNARPRMRAGTRGGGGDGDGRSAGATLALGASRAAAHSPPTTSSAAALATRNPARPAATSPRVA